MTQLSPRGARFISRYEGWRDKPYNDSANHATIGYGHLIHMGPVTPHDVTEWGTITVGQGVELLQADASVAERAIDTYITRALAQCERDALASFAFNCGAGSLTGHVGQAVNAKQDPTAALAAWNKDARGVEPGLVKRRASEALLFTTGDYDDAEPPLPPKAAVAKKKTSTPAAPPLTRVPTPVPDWAWLWVEWKLGRADYRGHAGDPDLRESTGAPATVPPWAWTFLKRF